MVEEVAVVVASVGVLREPGKIAPGRRRGVQVSVLPRATSSAQYKIAADHGRKADVFGPSAPRTRHRTLSLSQSPRQRGCRLRSPLRTPACCQPFGSGTVQRRAAVACRLVFSFAECAGSLVVGRGMSTSNGSSNKRVLGAQPMLLETPQSEENGFTRR